MPNLICPSAPPICIGVPVYNGEKFIGLTLDSLLAQTYPNFEIIISDNASSDNTEAICKEYMKKDKRIKYYRNEINLGAAKNFNRVFELSRSKYFRWNSADDICSPNLLEKCKNMLDTYPDAALCSVNTCIIDERNKIVKFYEDDLNLQHQQVWKRFLLLNLKLGLCNAQFGLMRSDVLRKTKLEGNYPGSDMVFLAEMILYGKFIQIPEFLFFRRFHASAFSSLASEEQQQAYWDPMTRGKIFLRTWKHLFENFRSVKRAPLKFLDKLSVFKVLMQLVVWYRKKMLQELVWGTQVFIKRLSFKNCMIC